MRVNNRLGRAVLLAAILLLSFPTFGLDAQAPNKLGIHLLLDDGRNQWPVVVWANHMGYARQAVGEWGYVTELVRGDDLDVARWQTFMDLCATLRLTPVLRLATTFDRDAQRWNAPTPDADGSYRTLAGQYAAFVAGLRWPTNAHYVVVGNEPNHGDEWSGRPDPAAYARFLIDVADALHSADPNAQVLNAGLDPYAPNTGSVPFANGLYYVDEESFMDGMVTAYPDVFAHIDVWDSHVYPQGPFSEGPWVQTYGADLINDATNPRHVIPPSGVYNRGINGYEWELFKLATYGITDLQVMITETGWRHAETSDLLATDSGSLPDAQTAAQYLDLALRGNNGRYPQYPADGWTAWLDDPRIIAVTPFAFDGLPTEWGHTNWLMLDAAGTVQGAYPSFEVMASGAS